MVGYYAASNPAVKSVAYLIAAFFITASLIAGFRTWRADRRAKVTE
jgi:membrane-associated protein